MIRTIVGHVGMYVQENLELHIAAIMEIVIKLILNFFHNVMEIKKYVIRDFFKNPVP